jgi:transposase
MAERGVVPIFLCPFSPDLNPIEALWDRMKDILGRLHPEVHRRSKELKAAVLEA